MNLKRAIMSFTIGKHFNRNFPTAVGGIGKKQNAVPVLLAHAICWHRLYYTGFIILAYIQRAIRIVSARMLIPGIQCPAGHFGSTGK
jgi:hypothetical protein